MVMCAIGTGMLWVGWYGFNAGSAVAADGVASNAFMTTTIATAVACFSGVEWITRGKPSVPRFLLRSGRSRRSDARLRFHRREGALINRSRGGYRAVVLLLQGQGPGSGMTMRWIRSVSTLWWHAGRVAHRLPRDADRQRQLEHESQRDIVGKTLWIEQLKAIGLTLAPRHRGHRRGHRLHRQGCDRPAPERGSGNRGSRPAEHGEEGYHQAR